MTTLENAKSNERKEWLRRFNRKVTNPLMMIFAGQRVYTIVDHVGRRSKKLYHTPVLGQLAGENFFIPLPYGVDTDWYLNVLAAGGCTVQWNGQTYQLASPQVVSSAAAEAVYPPISCFLLHAFRVQNYLAAKRLPDIVPLYPQEH